MDRSYNQFNKMKKHFFAIVGLLLPVIPFCQTPGELISQVHGAQKSLKSISYTIQRSDTLKNGSVRSISGVVKLFVDRNDSLYGFKFRSFLDKEKTKEWIYDGHTAYEVKSNTKTYKILTFSPQYMLLVEAGVIVIPDVALLDTVNATSFTMRQDKDFYYLTMWYPDIKTDMENITDRYKTVTIDKKNKLPMAVLKHNRSLGKDQTLYCYLTSLKMENHTNNSDFDSTVFLNGLTQQIIKPKKVELPAAASLIGSKAPEFQLSTFDDHIVSSNTLPGKVTLLDFWEVWCGPCRESMPKVQHLYDTYKEKGLQVYGIIHDTKDLEAAKKLVKQANFQFPMLLGNEASKKDFSVIAVPTYVLIDRTGTVVFVSEGFTEELEITIKKALN